MEAAGGKAGGQMYEQIFTLHFEHRVSFVVSGVTRIIMHCKEAEREEGRRGKDEREGDGIVGGKGKKLSAPQQREKRKSERERRIWEGGRKGGLRRRRGGSEERGLVKERARG